VTELDVLASLAALEQFGVVFEDAEELALVRDLASVRLASVSK